MVLYVSNFSSTWLTHALFPNPIKNFNLPEKTFRLFSCQSTVRVSHRLPLVFFVVSELKHRSSSSCFHRTQKVSFHFHYFGYCFACSYVFCLKNLFTFFLAKIILLLSKFDKIYRQRGKVSNFEDNYLN